MPHLKNNRLWRFFLWGEMINNSFFEKTPFYRGFFIFFENIIIGGENIHNGIQNENYGIYASKK